jgi:hypothetical protein
MGDDGDDASMRGGECGISDRTPQNVCSRNTEKKNWSTCLWNNLEIRRRHNVFFFNKDRVNTGPHGPFNKDRVLVPVLMGLLITPISRKMHKS